MPALIRNNAIVEDVWPFAAADHPATGQYRVFSLDGWLEAESPQGVAVELQPGEDCRLLADRLTALPLIAVNFPDFTDGRGFSIARELRDLGYRGELRARGHILPDQVHFLRRCGFDAFQPVDESRLQPSLARLQAFSEHYQAAADQPLPLFRRRA